MQLNDHELAAAQIHHYLQFEPTTITEIFPLPSDSTASDSDPLVAQESPTYVLESHRRRLLDIISNAFEKAVRDGNVDSITRNFKLLSLIGAKEQGIEKYGYYLCGTVKRKSQDRMLAPVNKCECS